jgi:hypothetical protein
MFKYSQHLRLNSHSFAFFRITNENNMYVNKYGGGGEGGGAQLKKIIEEANKEVEG